jgi:hypothetical protein
MTTSAGDAMTDRLTCHDMEILCRQRAVLESADSAKWLAEAERWRAREHEKATADFHDPEEGRLRAWPSPS